MDKFLTIEDFHALLTSDEGDNPLLAALRELTVIERTEEIVAAISDSKMTWAGDISDIH